MFCHRRKSIKMVLKVEPPRPLAFKIINLHGKDEHIDIPEQAAPLLAPLSHNDFVLCSKRSKLDIMQ